MVSMAASANLASKLEPIAYSLPPHFFILSSPKATMRGPSTTTMATFKQSFLKNLLSSLKNSSKNKAMSTLSERKRAIKSSADIAMATARTGIAGAARWPQAILASSSSSFSSSSSLSLPRTITFPCKMMQGKVRRCKSIVRRTPLMSSSEVARRLVRKRTKVLRRMIPEGELIADEISLLHEAMDYVVHLHAQVDVLRRVSRAAVARRSNASSSSSGGLAQLKERTVQISGETENPC